MYKQVAHAGDARSMRAKCLLSGFRPEAPSALPSSTIGAVCWRRCFVFH